MTGHHPGPPGARAGRHRQVLFVCTGNYYRSRFAEMLFDELAREAGLNWRATSRGVATELGRHNLGALSALALGGLAARGHRVPQPARRPRQLQAGELAAADRVVALNEAEHRGLLAARFAGWEKQVEYWHIDDVEVTSAAEALAQLEAQVRALIAELADDGF